MKKKWMYIFLLTVAVFVTFIYVIYSYVYANVVDDSAVLLGIKEKKKEFLKEYENVYGYGGLLEIIRSTETPHMKSLDIFWGIHFYFR
jgi:hypothetical protein